MDRGEAPKMPMHRDGTQNKKAWYKSMRVESYDVFWARTSREKPNQDIVVVLDKDSKVVLTKFSHVNPDHIFKTIDTKLARSLPRRILYDIPSQVLPIFTEEAVGLASEAVRFLFSTMAPDEYTKCLDVYKALPENNRVPLSEPTFSTLFVLGINSYTQRHPDNTDVKFGFASLVGLGSYTGKITQLGTTNFSRCHSLGGDLCFPQLAMKLEYQPGDCVIFRGRELEHFVHDWDGYRIFLLFTNHQPVRNYAYRKLGLLPPQPKDPWNVGGNQNAEEKTTSEADKEEEGDLDLESDDDGYYSPCWKEPVSPPSPKISRRESGKALLCSPAPRRRRPSPSSITVLIA
ncbi:cytoskeleton assembly control protein sla1 [Apiospora arundinis]